MKKMVTGVLALVMVLVMVGCGQKDNGVVNGVAKDGATIGEGAKSFTMEVVDKDGGKVTFTVKTDADTVGKALLDQGVIAGEDSSYGLYVKTVNGITLDYDTDGMYWAFYINGEYAQTGVDATGVEDGAVANTRYKLGGYPLVNGYVNLHLKRTRIFLQMYNLVQGTGKRSYFLAPHYPLNPRILKVGLSWNFFD